MDTAYKLFIRDLTRFEKNEDDWLFNFDVAQPKITINQFHIQGIVNKIAGEHNDILIVNDGTGNAKVTLMDTPGMYGDLSWLKQGAYCSIIGTLIKEGKLPHVEAVKLTKVESNILKDMWSLEVDELKNLMSKKITMPIS